MASIDQTPSALDEESQQPPNDAGMASASPKGSNHSSVKSSASPKGSHHSIVKYSDRVRGSRDSTKERRRSKGSDGSSNATATTHETGSTYQYSHESFETFKNKVSQLCVDIGFGEPEVEHMIGGSYNRIMGLKFTSRDPQNYILRIPRDGGTWDRSEDIKEQVAVLHHLSRHGSVPVPSISAFDTTQDNVIGSPYVLQERLPGRTLESIYYELPMDQKLQIATEVADLIMKMESVKLEKPGRLVGGAIMPAKSLEPLASTNVMSLAPYNTEKMGITKKMLDLEEQPLPSLLKMMLEYRKELCIGTQEDFMVDSWDALVKIVTEMEDAGFFRTTDNECVIWHWDFAARNILIEQAPVSEGDTGITANIGSLIQSKKCKHKVDITVDASSASKHSVKVIIEDGLKEGCKHQVEFSTEGVAGKIYRHSCQIEDEEVTTHPPPVKDISPGGLWTITGVLDWDGINSVPRVMTRSPPLWLWCNEDDRTPEWSGNDDIPPARELTQDELLIKAHFDQIMQRKCPSYLDDAYHRGLWIRRVARYAIYGFDTNESFPRERALVKEWKEYYASVRPNAADEEDSGSDESKDSEDSEDDSDSDGPEEGLEDGQAMESESAKGEGDEGTGDSMDDT